ncbi:hypothetical protein LCGC14_0231330 [marine sediment metagenome]|uniref:Thymidylate synthase (FAD) n=1 Tax=marine sediment metagenome TaxID=412755 RepID=A0A0F9WUJ5_9ZZZZ
MKLIRQSFEILSPLDGDVIMREIERSARLCYKSEDKIGPGSADKLVTSLTERGHYPMIELGGVIKIRFITNRGVSHELVRHRPCHMCGSWECGSFAMESTRYCNYSKGKHGSQITFIEPCWFPGLIQRWKIPEASFSEREDNWLKGMIDCEKRYFVDIALGAPPQEAREQLPQSLKTELDVMANIREWMHILTQRTSKAAHPQMRDLMLPLLKVLKKELPILFGDI